MNRRRFLQRLALVPIAGVLSEELVELLQPRRTIILPPSGGWPANAWAVNSLGGYFYSKQLQNVLIDSARLTNLLLYQLQRARA